MATETLDRIYDEWWNHPMSNPSPDALLSAVRTEAFRLTHDEDVAQNAILIVLKGLDRFTRSDATAFSRWVRSIIRRTRLEHYRSHSHHTREFNENDIQASAESSYVDTSNLPEGIKYVAEQLLAGHNLVSIAGQLNITSAALRNRLARYRKAALRNAA
jgi:DNA-directed RNA polymerase specialized sigma subunit